ncbi:MAG TPA: carboxypeptidase-like regulatory domain-containing protein [Elusimicrobiota bacterium]|nr:carboxypeptidase-like regulatory domain-containing protein [Elusimicrobiota bacterium]
MVLAAAWVAVAWPDADVGSIHGVVKFPGETPPPAMVANRDDRACPRGIGENHLLVNQTTLGLQNALVVLEPSPLPPSTLGRAQLTVRQCTIEPRIQWVAPDSGLFMRSDGPAAHHLHAYRDAQSVFEIDLPADGTEVRRPLVDPGLYKINCDRHLWERAWIYVTDNRTAALSDGNGEFMFRSIPPGRYTVRVWHEGWIETDPAADGRIERRPEGETKSVRVRADQTTEVRFDGLAPLEP